MQTLTQLADAARAVIAADRAGELTDEDIMRMEMALALLEQARHQGATEEQRAAAVLYQILGAYDAPAPALDVASALMRGEPLPFDPEELLPFVPPATEPSGESVAWLVVNIDDQDEQYVSARDRRRLAHFRASPGAWEMTPLGIIRQPAPAATAQPGEAVNQQLLVALKLALNSHGKMLMTNPPQDAWQHNRVDEICRAAITAAEAHPQSAPAAPEEVYGKTPGCKQCDEAEACGLTFCPECDALLAAALQLKEGGGA